MKIEKVFWISVLIALVNIIFFFFNDSLDYGLNLEKLMSGEWWRLFTYAFSHINLIHLIINITALMLLGMLASMVKISTKEFLIIFFIMLFIGVLGVAVVPTTNLVGLSLCITGLFGAVLVKFFKLDLFKIETLLLIVILLILTEFLVRSISLPYAYSIFVALFHVFSLFIGALLFYLIKVYEIS